MAMINFQSFKVEDYKEANKFLETHPIKGEMKLHEGHILVFYDVDDKDNRSNRIQYYRGMLEAHNKKQWEYQEQMWMNVELRNLFDKKTQPKEWNEANKSVITMAKMLEMEIFTTKVIIKMLAEIGVDIKQPEMEMPKIEEMAGSVSMKEVADNVNKNASKKGKA